MIDRQPKEVAGLEPMQGDGYRFERGDFTPGLIAHAAINADELVADKEPFNKFNQEFETGVTTNFTLVGYNPSPREKVAYGERLGYIGQVVTEVEEKLGLNAKTVNLIRSTPGTQIPSHHDPYGLVGPKTFVLIGLQGVGRFKIGADSELGMAEPAETLYGPGDMIILDPLKVYEDGRVEAATGDVSELSDPTVLGFMSRSHSAETLDEERTLLLIGMDAIEGDGNQAVANDRLRKIEELREKNPRISLTMNNIILETGIGN